MPLLLIRLSCVLASGDSSEGWEGQMSGEWSRVTTRRRFLGTAAGVTGALAVSAIESGRADAAGNSENTATLPATTRNFARGPVVLELGGTQQALLKSADGGDTIAQVITYRSGSEPVAHKQIGNVKYEDFALLTNFDIELPYAQWIVDMPNFQVTRKNGAVVVGDFNFAVRSRREFQQALISEITIPMLDASSKDLGYFTIGVTPEHASDGSLKGSISKKSQNVQKRWQIQNFRLEIDGLDCTRVNKIDSFTIKQKIVENRLGESRDVGIVAESVEFPDLAVQFGATSLPSWQKWFDDFVVKGNSSDSDEKSGRIVFLAPDLKTELGVLQFHHVGIYALDPDNEPDSAGALGESLARARALLYVEQMNFTKFGPYALT